MLILATLALAAPGFDFAERAPRTAPLRVGVIAGPTGGAVDLSPQYREFGIRYVRNNDYFDDRLDIEGILDCGGSTYPSWSGCDATNERHYHWEASDALMSTFKSGGFEPMLRLGGEWQNRSRKHDFKGPQDSTQEENWTIAATKVAVRYRHQYVYAGIWTEFPGVQFWDRSAADFYPFWVKAYRSVKAAVPEARVGGPGFAMKATKSLITGGKQRLAEQFLTTLYREGVRPDWIGWHIFSSDPTEYAAAGKAYRRLLDGTGEFSHVPWARSGFFFGVELVLDAFGHGRKSDGQALSAEVEEELLSGARGASATAAAFVAVSETDTTRAYYYRGNDPGTGAGGAGGGGGARGGEGLGGERKGPRFGKGDGAAEGSKAGGRRPELGGGGGGGGGAGGGSGSGWLGMFARDGSPKLIASVVRLWVRMGDEFPKQVAVSDPGGNGIWAVAATGSAGTAVFLTNYSDRSITVNLADVPGRGTSKSATVRLVDEAHDGMTASSVPVGSLEMAPWQVGMVVFPSGAP